MKLFSKLFKKNDLEPSVREETKKTEAEVHEVAREEAGRVHEPPVDQPAQVKKGAALDAVAPKEVGKLDMVIAFDTTGSMAAYIEAVRREVSDLIPQLFRDNPDLRLGIVAFGDYCDMRNAQEFGAAYQSVAPTDNENELMRFIKESKDTSGGDGDEFYELVIRKIVDETPWREGSMRSILLIADAWPHPLGYTYRNYVVDNRIDWREEAGKAASLGIRIDTVTITDAEWFRELSRLTNGTSVPFQSSYKTGRMMQAAIYSKGSRKARRIFDEMYDACEDEEMKAVYHSLKRDREEME